MGQNERRWRGGAALPACVVAALLVSAPAYGAATVRVDDGVLSIAASGEGVVVTGADGTVSLRGDLDPGSDPGCTEADGVVRCDSGALARARVELRPASYNELTVTGAIPVPLNVLGSESRDEVVVDEPGPGDAFRDPHADAYPSDRLELGRTGRAPVHLRPASSPAPGAATHSGFETLVGGPLGDTLVAGPGLFWIDSAGGNDQVDVMSGPETPATCGDGPDDRVTAPTTRRPNEFASCEIFNGQRLTDVPPPPIVRSPAPLPPAPPSRPYARVFAVPPTLDGTQMRMTLRRPHDHWAVILYVASWRPGGPVHASPQFSERSTLAARFAPVAYGLPPDVLAHLGSEGRLRIRASMSFERYLPIDADAVLVGPRRPRVTRDGVRRTGSFGSQRLVGGPRGDLLDGRSANDHLLARRGNDRLLGGTGNDTLAGEQGDDHLEGDDGDDVLRGGAGDDDLIEGRFGEDRLFGGPGDDVLVGGRAGDVLEGGEGDDVLRGGSGGDTFRCGPGEDVAFVNFAREERRTSGCEHVYDEDGVPLVTCVDGGTEGDETVLGTEGDDVCAGGAGNDDVEGRGGDDVLAGDAGNDRIFGRFGVDRLSGDDGDDELEGGRGRDVLDGGAGADQVNGGFDPDVVRGGAGDDVLIARGGGRDRLDCGSGHDTAYVDSRDVAHGCERVVRSGSR